MNNKFTNQFKYPNSNLFGLGFDLLFNNFYFNKLKRIAISFFNISYYKSDVKNVVYLNWLVKSSNVNHLIPNNLNLKKFGDYTLFSILIFQHGNFRPTILNKLKKIFPSPNQANIRLYLAESPSPLIENRTVFFVKNIISNFLHVLGSRIYSCNLNSHYPKEFKHTLKDGIYSSKIIANLSNSIDLDCQLQMTDNWEIPESFLQYCSNKNLLLEIICNQDFAISDLMEENYLSKAKINLKIDFDIIKCLKVINLESKYLDDIVKNSNCFAFVIPKLEFNALGEEII